MMQDLAIYASGLISLGIVLYVAADMLSERAFDRRKADAARSRIALPSAHRTGS
jgi:hypothetical protein